MRKSPFSPSQPLFSTPLLLTLIFILVSVLISILALDRRRNKRRRRKLKMEKTKQKTTAKQSLDNSTNSKQVVWDCGSSLYDSFELKAIEKELDSAIASSRTSSMPHLSDGRPPPPPPPPSSKKPKSSKISRSLNRLIRSVWRPKNNNNINSKKEGFAVVYDRSGPLSTVPEAPEFDEPSPEIRSFLRRTASDRFGAKIVPR